MSGWLSRLRLDTPRISMLGPAPNRPVEGTMLTPATRELSSELMSGACDLASTSGALTLPTALPNSRCCWPPAVPVTITASSEVAAGASAKSTVSWPSVPTVTVRRRAAYPTRRATRVCWPWATPAMRYWPESSVTAPSGVPSTCTEAPTTGAFDVESTTRPTIVSALEEPARCRVPRRRRAALVGEAADGRRVPYRTPVGWMTVWPDSAYYRAPT